MKILILQHIEPLWEEKFNIDELINNVIKHINRSKYDKVILTTLEYTGGYEELKPFIDMEKEFSYAWENPETEKEWYKNNNIDTKDIIEVSTPHGWAYLYDWIKRLKGHKVSVCGGYDGECLTDLQDILTYLNIPFKRVESCIY